MRVDLRRLTGAYGPDTFAGSLPCMMMLLATGCAAIRNPQPDMPQPSLVAQWQSRYSSRLCVCRPATNDFEAQFETRRLADLLVKSGHKLKMLKEEEIDLEDVFMGITKGITS